MIQQHQLLAIKSSNDEDFQRINIRRSQVYSDALQYFSKKAFDVEKLLKACFIRQEAVDLGILFHDVMAVANDTYYTVGKMLSTTFSTHRGMEKFNRNTLRQVTFLNRN